MRRFGTQGPVHPDRNYIVTRTEEIDDFIRRIQDGRYIVVFAPRQTGKTTFFLRALEVLANPESIYLTIQLNFEEYHNSHQSIFYTHLLQDIYDEIEKALQLRNERISNSLQTYIDDADLTEHISMRRFFMGLEKIIRKEYNIERIILIIDEFDGIPEEAVTGFLHSLRRIYLSDSTERCPHSVGIVGVKNITQLNFDRSISPFNVQDEFYLPNFNIEQVRELLLQYTHEVGQQFDPMVIESIHKQTAGQPFLVNRIAQILTEELEISKTETISIEHFLKAHSQILHESNTNIEHLTSNVRKNPKFESILMKIMASDDSVPFNLRDELISELSTYGVIRRSTDGMCEIANPIYLYTILQTFKPTVNGLEQQYLPEDTNNGFLDYLTSDGNIQMMRLLDNFRDFIARAGYKILEVPDTPQESVGRHLLLSYLEQFVKLVGGFMHIEVQTGRGRLDLLITHNQRKYIVETKVWRGNARYDAGKRQLASYLKTEGASEGYYVVFDHRTNPEPRSESDVVDGYSIRSYVIPVLQHLPSNNNSLDL
ncbi:AAA-like domain-containing protein [Candidatus Poribacteria bacterium]|nr:AAA-like domain-containing protein [Candidatus Poribacteria bacterium]